MLESDSYNCILTPNEESLFKDKGSKFIGYAYSVNNEEDIKLLIEEVKKIHYSARHHCYAYRIGTSEIKYRANDDGEPSNSAGNPILGQIQSKELTNTLVIVVRYFGGIKLGVGGLINAYKTAAKDVLDICTIETKTINEQIKITGEYNELNQIMRFIKEHNLKIVSQDMGLNVVVVITIRKKYFNDIFDKLSKMHKLTIKKI